MQNKEASSHGKFPTSQSCCEAWPKYGAIARACRDCRREHSVELICVSKGFDANAILPSLAAGKQTFGENRVQEATEKWPRCARNTQIWHSIYWAAAIQQGAEAVEISM